MWAWGFLFQRLLPSVVVMLTTYAVVLVVIAVFRVTSRNARIALLLLPLYKSLAALAIGVPIVTMSRPMRLYMNVKLPDVDQLPFWPGQVSDSQFGKFSATPTGLSTTASWASAFNWVLAVLIVVAGLIVACRLAQFVTFYRRICADADLAADVLLRGAPQRAAGAIGIQVPKLIAVDAPHAFVPFTIGWRRPLVVLPEKLLDPKLLTDAQIESVLAHEFAHIKRRDYLLNWVFSVADSLLFYNPLTSRIVSRAYEAAEEACDGLAARTTHRPSALVDALVRIARETREGGGAIRKLDPRLLPANIQPHTNTLMSGQHLKKRVVRLESGEAIRIPPVWLRATKTVPLVLFVALFALVQINFAFLVGGRLLFLQ